MVKSKSQKRRQKIIEKAGRNGAFLQQIDWINKEKLKKANTRLYEALEIVLKRVRDKLGLDDLPARYMLADLLEQQILVETGVPINRSSRLVGHQTDIVGEKPEDPVLENTGFDKEKWAPPQ